MTMHAKKEKIAVIGAGLMGHGIAQVFADAGHPVAIHDPDPAALARVPERVREIFRQLDADPSPVERISLHERLEDAVQGAQFVIEAGPERVPIKQEIFATLDALTQGTCGVVVDHELMALLFELRLKRQHHLLHRAGGQHFHLRRGRMAHGESKRGGDKSTHAQQHHQ